MKPKHPPIKSYVRRIGRITPSQRQALKETYSRFGLTFDKAPLDFASIFQRQAPCILEIGFGDGESLLKQAIDNPQKNYIGIEVHTPGVGRLLANIGALGLKNIRVIEHDAVDVLKYCIPDGSLDGVQVFFPDPWHKKRHNKRRLVQLTFVEQVVEKLKSGGCLHLATDWTEYAEHMVSVLSQVKDLTNQADEGVCYLNAYALRPMTKFEARGLRLGHQISDLVYIK
jgi:tRNA (guanine-N7-)-methyltransferase